MNMILLYLETNKGFLIKLKANKESTNLQLTEDKDFFINLSRNSLSLYSGNNTKEQRASPEREAFLYG